MDPSPGDEYHALEACAEAQGIPLVVFVSSKEDDATERDHIALSGFDHRLLPPRLGAFVYAAHNGLDAVMLKEIMADAENVKGRRCPTPVFDPNSDDELCARAHVLADRLRHNAMDYAIVWWWRNRPHGLFSWTESETRIVNRPKMLLLRLLFWHGLSWRFLTALCKICPDLVTGLRKALGSRVDMGM